MQEYDFHSCCKDLEVSQTIYPLFRRQEKIIKNTPCVSSLLILLLRR